ncbi:MAG: DUF2090 domain-containing protein [Candidatus Pacebacteria bacterium]|nr:DUF2090 domain-containing protein [Candidatus Paceibacterota bacterium]
MENKAFLGYSGTLAILPFDHRTGLYKAFGWTEPLTPEEIIEMKDGRQLIFEAIEHAVLHGIPKESAPVFTDDVFGAEVLKDAKEKGFVTFLTTEKSGATYFDFEHGDNFGDAINAIKPTFTKALVRYNPDVNLDDNKKSLENLKKLSDFSHANGYKFLIEPLVAATNEQLASVDGDKHRYDNEVRPELTMRMIKEMQDFGIEPDVWKIEGFEHTDAYEKIVSAARANGRDTIGIITLGRNETDEVVASWLRASSPVPGVIGFAVGRTVFLDPLLRYRKGELSREEAVTKISEKFSSFFHIFKEA